jgi:hypothetical protein
MPGEYL